MKSFTLSALLALSFLGLALGPPQPSAAIEPVDRFEEFEQKFRQAMKINAKEEMAKLLDRYSWEAVLTVITYCEAISNQSNDDLETFIASMNEAWKKQYDGSEFVDKVYEYFSLLDPTVKRNRIKLKNLFSETRTQMLKNEQGDKDGPTFAIHGSEFERLALGFTEMEDWYHASESWISYAGCFDQGNRGAKNADLYKACAGYKKALDAREKIDLMDKRYREIEPIFKLYERQGYLKDKGDDGSGGGGKDAPVTEDTAGALTSVMTFELIDSFSKFKRPNYNADDIFPAWTSIGLQGKGSTGTLAGLEDCPKFHRLAIADVRIDLAGDGPDNDEKIKMTGNAEPVSFKIGQGAEERMFGMLTVVGGQSDMYQGIQTNLAPSDEFFTLYCVAAGSVVGTLGETPVRVIDDNMDGIYGSPPVEWGHMGVIEGHFQSDMDSIVIGSSKRAVPWSEYQNVEGNWFKFEAENKGTSLRATPVEFDTGTLKLKTKGPKPEWVVVRGTGRLENCFYDLLQNGAKGVQVPVGSYELFLGRVSKGKKLQVMKALIVPGDTTPTWEVNPGETTTVELGAPFGFEFKYEVDDEVITIDGTDVVITGKQGERYERTWNCVPKPEISFRKEDSKRGSKPEKMVFVQSPQELQDLGFRACWFPRLPGGSIDRSRVKGDILLQLTDKKNKLFGKIVSDWK